MGNEQGSEFDGDDGNHEKERRANSNSYSGSEKERRVEPKSPNTNAAECKSNSSKKPRDQAGSPDPTLIGANSHLMREKEVMPLSDAGSDALQEFSRCVAEMKLIGLFSFCSDLVGVFMFILSELIVICVNSLAYLRGKWRRLTQCRSLGVLFLSRSFSLLLLTPSMQSPARLVGRVMGEDGRIKNIFAVDPSQLTPEQLMQLRDQEYGQLVDDTPRFQCGGYAVFSSFFLF
jgi:hypothetical protein